MRVRSGLSRQQQRAAGTEVLVVGVELVRVERREIVIELQALPVEFQQTSP